jgi:hypothetical protein
VNPDQQVQWLKYQGYSTDATLKSTAAYATAQTLWAQVQPLPTDELAHLENLNIQGVLRQVYLRGAIASAVREDGTGGDVLQFPEIAGGAVRTWLVMVVAEQWNEGYQGAAAAWCRVIVRLQNFTP